MDRPEPILALDRARGIVHKRSCPALLGPDVQSETYVGLEHCLHDGRFALCICVVVYLMRSVASAFNDLAEGADCWPARYAHQMRQNADVLERHTLDLTIDRATETNGEPPN